LESQVLFSFCIDFCVCPIFAIPIIAAMMMATTLFVNDARTLLCMLFGRSTRNGRLGYTKLPRPHHCTTSKLPPDPDTFLEVSLDPEV
jgi:hypothetical protein